jgi:putative ATPase
MSSGDARIALDTLGFISENLRKGGRINRAIIGEAMQRQTTFYDRSEDKYNLLSALQKSVRGSDPDAAVHYLARLLEGGADIQMIGRRLMVMASEDIGMAYPQAISIVTGCVQAALMIGLPEARINLSQATILLASCPKSNSAISALEKATTDLQKKNIDDVPDHLKDSHYSGAKKRGLGIGYKYPHAYGGYVKQQYLPDNLYKEGVKYYEPTENGKEGAFKRFLESLDKLK